jgi:hypothetical protein
MGLTSFVSLSGSWEEGAGSELINESRRTDPKSHWHVMLGHCQIESEPPRTTNRVRPDSQTVPFPFESESLTVSDRGPIDGL